MTAEPSPAIRVAVAHFPPTVAAVPEVRARTVLTLSQWSVDGNAVSSAEIVVCELASNAAKASRPQDVVAIRMTATLGIVLIEVWDGNDSPPRVKTPDMFSEDGRGLLMVDELSSQWWWYPVKTGGKVVWAEIPGGLEPDPQATHADPAMPTRTPTPVPEPAEPVFYQTDPGTLRRVVDALRGLDTWHLPPSDRHAPEATARTA